VAFEKQRGAAVTAGEPFISLSAARGFSDGETIPIVDTDWSGEELTCKVATAPGQPALATLSVSLSTETKTWQEYEDECFAVEDYMECDDELTDETTTTLLSLNWSATSFELVPLASSAGEPVSLYFEIHRSNDTGPRLASGELTLTERIGV